MVNSIEALARSSFPLTLLSPCREIYTINSAICRQIMYRRKQYVNNLGSKPISTRFLWASLRMRRPVTRPAPQASNTRVWNKRAWTLGICHFVVLTAGGGSVILRGVQRVNQAAVGQTADPRDLQMSLHRISFLSKEDQYDPTV